MSHKSLRDISWLVDEPTYREDPALSYSTLAKYEREGFNNLSILFDRVESPSLTFGQCVDTLITGSEEEFNRLFLVANFPALEPANVSIVKAIFELYKDSYARLALVPDRDIILITEQKEYHLNWKPETRAKVIKEKCEEYYNLLRIAENKTIIDTETYNQVLDSVAALKESEATKDFFAPNNPFDDSIERLYQLKFKATLHGIDYRCMADLLYCDYDEKKIYPIDLKTSSHTEWDFYKSFVQWNYQIQARLYWRIIRHNMDADDYFKDFILTPYQFVVVNKVTKTPLVWVFAETMTEGMLTFGKDIKFRDPEFIGWELSHYLTNKPKVPMDIDLKAANSLAKWLNKE